MPQEAHQNRSCTFGCTRAGRSGHLQCFSNLGQAARLHHGWQKSLSCMHRLPPELCAGTRSLFLVRLRDWGLQVSGAARLCSPESARLMVGGANISGQNVLERVACLYQASDRTAVRVRKNLFQQQVHAGCRVSKAKWCRKPSSELSLPKTDKL